MNEIMVVIHCAACTGGAGRRDLSKVRDRAEGPAMSRRMTREEPKPPYASPFLVHCRSHGDVLVDEPELDRKMAAYRQSGRVQHLRAVPTGSHAQR